MSAGFATPQSAAAAPVLGLDLICRMAAARAGPEPWHQPEFPRQRGVTPASLEHRHPTLLRLGLGNQGMGIKTRCCILLASLAEGGHGTSMRGGARGEVCRRAEQIVAALGSDPASHLEAGQGFLEGSFRKE